MYWKSGAEDARTPNAHAWSAVSAGAKRLECVRFIGAFVRATTTSASWSKYTASGQRRLSMNPPALRATTSHESNGSWYITTCCYLRGNRSDQPTPNPSQEGNRRISFGSPPWRGWGWVRAMRVNRMANANPARPWLRSTGIGGDKRRLQQVTCPHGECEIP